MKNCFVAVVAMMAATALATPNSSQQQVSKPLKEFYFSAEWDQISKCVDCIFQYEF